MNPYFRVSNPSYRSGVKEENSSARKKENAQDRGMLFYAFRF
ncbi:hypothetical protein Hanom_Chr17g01535291 [Helianthus anomalus]